nr:MAG TPA: type I restriction enzyme R protein [Caudoviricetes sp.]
MNFNKYTWELYKQTNGGKETVSLFQNAAHTVSIYELVSKYNPMEAKFTDKDNIEDCCELLWELAIEQMPLPANIDEARNLYEQIIDGAILFEDGEVFIGKADYKTYLMANMDISFMLFFKAPEYFFPNMFRYHFFDLIKIFDSFGIDLPSPPKKSDYRARCMYYWELCETLYNFREENGLSPFELCALLYDFGQGFTRKMLSDLPKPSKAWFIGGRIMPEEDLDFIFWQANEDTMRGDILIHYETRPICAITCMWIAQTDGVIDPFFYYYANTYIGNRIKLPHISLQELKNDEYFASHSLIRKNFQGVNGWEMNNKDYVEILRMIQAKGYDISNLPTLYSPKMPCTNINLEKDVEEQLLIPLLHSMGMTDYMRQVPLRAGRGERIYPDFALHCTKTDNGYIAKVLIEAKLSMRNKKEVYAAFQQANSYAHLMESPVIILCDKEMILVYTNENGFNRNRYKRFFWEDMENPDKFNELKRILI